MFVCLVMQQGCACCCWSPACCSTACKVHMSLQHLMHMLCVCGNCSACQQYCDRHTCRKTMCGRPGCAGKDCICVGSSSAGRRPRDGCPGQAELQQELQHDLQQDAGEWQPACPLAQRMPRGRSSALSEEGACRAAAAPPCQQGWNLEGGMPSAGARGSMGTCTWWAIAACCA
jgi:hypothetical protein